MRVGMSKSTLRPVWPWAIKNLKRSLVAPAVPKPAICLMVQGCARYMVGYGPRVKGYWPGKPSFST